MTINGQEDPQVHVVPVPARSLRPGSPERAGAAADQQSLAQDSGGGPGSVVRITLLEGGGDLGKEVLEGRGGDLKDPQIGGVR